MTIAYFDCASGISGDMTLGALVDAGVELDQLNETIASLGLSDCQLTAEEVRRCGFRATRVQVHFDTNQSARHLPEILQIVGRSRLRDGQKARVEQIFRRLAQVEAHVHGIDVEKVHFHELGAVDTIVDVVGAVVGLERLGVERIVASPIAVGAGTIQMAHGRVSVPAPATAELLRDVPLAASDIEAELTTPTGAAIIGTLAESFGSLPAMTVRAVGCGAGGRDLATQPNLLRILIGDVVQSDAVPVGSPHVEADEVWLLETNLDNATGETIGHCLGQLRDRGALDAWTTPIQMKKDRPGVLVSVLCQPGDAAALETILFAETPTLGVRRRLLRRHVLRREAVEVDTPWGKVAGKVRHLPDATTRFAPECESCRETAQRSSVSLEEVYEAARRAFKNG